MFWKSKRVDEEKRRKNVSMSAFVNNTFEEVKRKRKTCHYQQQALEHMYARKQLSKHRPQTAFFLTYPWHCFKPR